jgi:DNA polymerase/3'-5' exonuclease PolX
MNLDFTGGKWFNRSMRLWATQKYNCKLSDEGLFEISSGKSILRGATREEEVFNKLRLRYKAPSERLFFDDVEPL